MPPLRLGTRGSPLALIQTDEAVRALAHAGVPASAVVCQSQGDRDRQSALAVIGGQGVFVREIEEALTEGRVDVAVHSAKDVPTTLLPGAVLAAYLPRQDVRDVLVTRTGIPLAALPAGARMGSSSRRRVAQVRALRPDLVFDAIRGNVETRLRKVHDGEFDATVLAAAGLARLQRMDAASEVFTIDQMLPAPGQGAIVLQARADDAETLDLLRRITHEPTALAVRAERAFLAAFGAGCVLPIAALGHVSGPVLTLAALVADDQGRRVIRAQQSGAAAGPEAIGAALAAQIRQQGADALLQEARR